MLGRSISGRFSKSVSYHFSCTSRNRSVIWAAVCGQSVCSSRQSAVSRPEQAAASTDCRNRFRIAGTLASRCRAAFTRASNASTFATMRCCSANGGRGMPNASKYSRFRLLILVPADASEIAWRYLWVRKNKPK